MIDREAVQDLQRWAERVTGKVQRFGVTPETLAELCRCWLAVDSAPEVELREGAPINTLLLVGLLGQTVRLVPLATARGAGNG